MSQNPELLPSTSTEWRERAEQRLKGQPPESGRQRSPAQTERLVEELRVHQIELELQNDELRADVEAGLESFTDLYEFAPVGYFTLTVDSKIRRTNLKGAQLFGLERARLAGRRFRVYVSQGSRAIFDAWLEQVFSSGSKEACVVALAREGAPSRPVQLEATLSPHGQEAWVAVADMTGRKTLEEQLRQAQKMEVVGQLAGGVAHDFNNILAAMMLNLDVLQKRCELPAEARPALHVLDALAKRASSLTGQLLLFSRRQTLQSKPLELNETLTHLLKMLERTLGEHISFVRIGDNRKLWVTGDAPMLEQAITNLCLNARDAMPNGGFLTLETSAVEFGAECDRIDPKSRPGEFVCLRISDTGCGMSDDVLEHLCEPFFTTKEIGKGTGLGLASAYGVAEQHQGWLSVESIQGLGSSFRLYLPRSRKPRPTPDTEPPIPLAERGGQTILLVEDEPELLHASARALTQFGYNVLSAQDGPGALKLWEQSRGAVDLLLTDMRMPKGINGLQLAERLWETKPELKVVIMSGYNAEMSTRVDAQQAGYVFLAKPFDSETLERAVRACLDAANTELQDPSAASLDVP